MTDRKIVVCRTHHRNEHPTCLSCRFAIDWNIRGKYCHCSQPATGYRVTGKDIPAEFFCDEHFQGVPQVEVAQ